MNILLHKPYLVKVSMMGGGGGKGVSEWSQKPKICHIVYVWPICLQVQRFKSDAFPGFQSCLGTTAALNCPRAAAHYVKTIKNRQWIIIEIMTVNNQLIKEQLENQNSRGI